MKEACSDRNSRVRLENVGKRRVHSRHGLPALGSTRCCNEWNTFSYYFSPCHPGCAYCSSAHSSTRFLAQNLPSPIDVNYRNACYKQRHIAYARQKYQHHVPCGPVCSAPALTRPT